MFPNPQPYTPHPLLPKLYISHNNICPSQTSQYLHKLLYTDISLLPYNSRSSIYTTQTPLHRHIPIYKNFSTHTFLNLQIFFYKDFLLPPQTYLHTYLHTLLCRQLPSYTNFLYRHNFTTYISLPTKTSQHRLYWHTLLYFFFLPEQISLQRHSPP